MSPKKMIKLTHRYIYIFTFNYAKITVQYRYNMLKIMSFYHNHIFCVQNDLLKMDNHFGEVWTKRASFLQRSHSTASGSARGALYRGITIDVVYAFYHKNSYCINNKCSSVSSLMPAHLFTNCRNRNTNQITNQLCRLSVHFSEVLLTKV